MNQSLMLSPIRPEATRASTIGTPKVGKPFEIPSTPAQRANERAATEALNAFIQSGLVRWVIARNKKLALVKENTPKIA